MASEKQIAANRRNAQQSTGPRSVEGKVRSSQNALKTGLYAQGIVIGSELASKLEELERQFTEEYNPTTPTERSLVDQLIHCEWLLRRFRWMETEVWKVAEKRIGRECREISTYGYAYADNPAIARIYRQRASISKTHRETIAQLQRVRAAREANPEPAPQLIDPKPSSDEIGFVPSKPNTPAPAPTSPLLLTPQIGFVPSISVHTPPARGAAPTPDSQPLTAALPALAPPPSNHI